MPEAVTRTHWHDECACNDKQIINDLRVPQNWSDFRQREGSQ